jgi:hypothetical protein
MAVIAETGTFQIASGGTGTQAVTLTGALASTTPQLVLFFHRQTTGTASNTGSNFFSMGAMTAAEQFATAFTDTDNVATSASFCSFNTSGCILEISALGARTGLAAFSSFGSGSFTINKTDAFALTTDVDYIAIAGLTNVFIKTTTLPGATGNFSVTGVGFQPDAMILVSNATTATDTATNNARFSMGFVDLNANQFAISHRLLNNTSAANQTSAGWTATNRVLTLCDTDGSAGQPQVSAASGWEDADGYTLNRVTGTSAFNYAAICMKGGSLVVGNTTTQTGTGNFAVTTTGCTPAAVLLLCHPLTVTSLTDASPRDAETVIGVGTSSTARFCHWVHSRNGNPTETYSRRSTSKILENYDRSGADTLSAIGDVDLVSFSNGSFTLNQTDADAQLSLLGFLAIGNASTTVPRFMNQYRQRRRG